jgi:uncharacterized membrane protein YjgN (DUF898 family)
LNETGALVAITGPRVALAPEKSVDSVTTLGEGLSSLVWLGSFRTIVTLGIYRFWYKTDLRRWYWSNTLVGGHSLEYRGTASEKFLGFLYALAVVAPIYFLGALVGLFAGETLGSLVSSLSGLGFAFLVQYGAYRSRRYRLTRTTWRGLRFDLKGSARIYALKSLGWGFVSLITLGLAFPAMRRALEDYRITNTWFGTAQGHFTARTGPVMKRWFVLWGGVLVFAAVSTVISINGGIETASPFIFLAALWPLLLWPWYRAHEFRHFTAHTTLGEVSFQSAFMTSGYYWLFLKFIGIVLIGLLLTLLIPGMIYALLKPTVSRLDFLVDKSILILVLPLAWLGSFYWFSCFKEIILNQGFWRLTAGTLAIHNLEAVESILGTAVNDEAATGEGLADALDFGGI